MKNIFFLFLLLVAGCASIGNTVSTLNSGQYYGETVEQQDNVIMKSHAIRLANFTLQSDNRMGSSYEEWLRYLNKRIKECGGNFLVKVNIDAIKELSLNPTQEIKAIMSSRKSGAIMEANVQEIIRWLPFPVDYGMSFSENAIILTPIKYFSADNFLKDRANWIPGSEIVYPIKTKVEIILKKFEQQMKYYDKEDRINFIFLNGGLDAWKDQDVVLTKCPITNRDIMQEMVKSLKLYYRIQDERTIVFEQTKQPLTGQPTGGENHVNNRDICVVYKKIFCRFDRLLGYNR